MRYNVHSPCAFRNRIAKSIGVLVAAALIATLGLPSAAQAQTIGSTGVIFTDGTGFTVTWSSRFATSGDNSVDNWIVRFTEPDGDKVVLHENLANQADLADATTITVDYDDNDLGTWWIQVDACFEDLPDATGSGDTKDVCPTGSLEAGTAVGYTHGAPAAPENLTASLVPGGVALTWTPIMGDRGIHGYQYSKDGKAWKDASAAGANVVQVDPGEYTFMVRARGTSDNDLNTDPNVDDAEAAEVNGAAASVEITVGDGAVVDEEDEDPVPTPTLPEIAALLLGTLLLGSGAYLLRGRQSGGLSQA